MFATHRIIRTLACVCAANLLMVSAAEADSEPSISIDSVTVSESDGNAVFTVTQSATSGVDTTFQYSTGDATATDGSDYTGVANAPGLIPAGDTTTTISIPITGGAAGALNGNLAANRTVKSFTINGLSLAIGQDILLRWSDPITRASIIVWQLTISRSRRTPRIR
jgi:hypothetical protein